MMSALSAALALCTWLQDAPPQWRAFLDADSATRPAVEDAILKRITSDRVVDSAHVPGSAVWLLHLSSGEKVIFRVEDAGADLAAYRLSRALGLDFVPPTAPYEFEGRKGTVQLFVEGVEGRQTVPKAGRSWIDEPWTSQSVDARDAANARIFDYLILAPDRNGKNWRIAVDSAGRQRLVLYDHADMLYELLGFKTQGELMEIETATRSFYERLKSIPREQLIEAVAVLKETGRKPQDIEAVAKNRDTVVARLESLRSERGESAVLLEDRFAAPSKSASGKARREIGGAATILAAMVLKEAAQAAATLDATRAKEVLAGMGSLAFWREFLGFVAGMRGSEEMLDGFGWLRRRVPGWLWRQGRSHLPLGAGAALAAWAGGRDVSAIEVGLIMASYPAAGEAVGRAEQLLRKLARWNAPIGGRWGRLVRVVRLAAVLMLGERIEEGLRRASAPTEGVRRKLEQMP